MAEGLNLSKKRFSKFQDHFFRAQDLVVIAEKYLGEHDAGENHELFTVFDVVKENLTEMQKRMVGEDVEVKDV